MKRLFLLSGSLLILFLMTACGGATEPAAVSSESDAQDTAEAVVETTEDEVVEAVEEEIVEEVVEEEPEVEIVEESVEEAVVEEDPQEEVAEAESAAEEVVIVSPTDYQLIGQTGRPQFINSFATW